MVGSGGLSDGRVGGRPGRERRGGPTSLTTADGPLDALVADAPLTARGRGGRADRGGARLAEQRYLAELAALTMQAPEGTEQTVLVAPPRDVEARPEGAGAMMADTASLPWLRPAHRWRGARRGPSAPAGELWTPSTRPARPGRSRRRRAAEADPPGPGRRRDRGRRRRARSLRRRDGPARCRPPGAPTPRASARPPTGLPRRMDRLRGRVTLLAPADGTYSLASSRRAAGPDRAERPALRGGGAPPDPDRAAAGCPWDPWAPSPCSPASAPRCRCRPSCGSPAGSR